MPKPTLGTRLARKTESDLVKLRDFVQTKTLAIGYRFGDIDNSMVSAADTLMRDVEQWIEDVRAHMDEAVREDAWKF